MDVVLFEDEASPGLYQGQIAGNPDTIGWDSDEAGRWWYNLTENHYYFWNGTEILIMG